MMMWLRLLGLLRAQRSSESVTYSMAMAFWESNLILVYVMIRVHTRVTVICD